MEDASTTKATATPASKLWPWLRCFIVLGVHFFLVLFVVLMLATFVPIFMRLFELENLELPAITQQLYGLSQFLVSYWYLLFVLWMVLDVPVMVVLTIFSDRIAWLRTLYEYAWLLGTIMILFWAALCVAMPLQKLVIHKMQN